MVDEERRQTIVAAPNNLQYIVAIIVMVGVGVAAITMIVIFRPDQDNATVITAIIGFLAPSTLSLLALLKSQETHLSVNSRLDAFMQNAKLAAHAQGMTAGRSEARAESRTDAALDVAVGAAPGGTHVVEAPVIVIAPRPEHPPK